MDQTLRTFDTYRIAGRVSTMASTLIRNVVMVCSVAALCAALLGCSSSNDGRMAELEKDLDMAEAVRDDGGRSTCRAPHSD